MEVPCYPEHTIAEFNKRIDSLRGEYKAFIRKIRQLEPDLQVTPWTDRPYAKRKRAEIEPSTPTGISMIFCIFKKRLYKCL